MTKYEKTAFDMLTKALDGAEIHWVDTTWGNDVTASVGIGEEPQLWVYVPNAMVDDIDNEEFSHFAVCNEDGDILSTMYNVPDVVSFLSLRE